MGAWSKSTDPDKVLGLSLMSMLRISIVHFNHYTQSYKDIKLQVHLPNLIPPSILITQPPPQAHKTPLSEIVGLNYWIYHPVLWPQETQADEGRWKDQNWGFSTLVRGWCYNFLLFDTAHCTFLFNLTYRLSTASRILCNTALPWECAVKTQDTYDSLPKQKAGWHCFGWYVFLVGLTLVGLTLWQQLPCSKDMHDTHMQGQASWQGSQPIWWSHRLIFTFWSVLFSPFL